MDDGLQNYQLKQDVKFLLIDKQLKLGNAYTYANKLGFGASPFFKLGEEK